jgi:aspartyl/asparaginyl-tRNA synthetase
MTQLIDPVEYTKTLGLLRSFFLSKDFLEVHTQNRLSILAACEDPTTVSTYNYIDEMGKQNIWPLPQTGQMWLEYELLTKPDSKGFFCISTSYRQEPNLIPGRHDVIFPMFEFEMPGNFDDLEELERELCEYMGLGKITAKDYDEWSNIYNTREIDSEIERLMFAAHGACMIKNFPNHTSPFWNMKQNKDGNTAAKIDVILGGMETIGSAERSTDVVEMREMFNTISDGGYAKLLHDLFGRDRVQAELDEFLSHDFFPRVGGGIGLTRMISALNSK